MNFRKAQLEVSRVREALGDTPSYSYREVTPNKIDYKPAIITFLASLAMIVGLFTSIYFFL